MQMCRLAKELLAARQRAAAAEEEKQRQAQASAIANHRQIFLDQVGNLGLVNHFQGGPISQPMPWHHRSSPFLLCS